MPIVLTPHEHVPCPLGATHQASWAAFPQLLKGPLLPPPG